MKVEGVEIVEVGRDSRLYSQAVALKYDIFYRDHGLPLSAAVDDIENISNHFVAVLGEQDVVGYIRVTLEERKARISQFAVSESMRGKASVSRQLLFAAMEFAKMNSVEMVYGEIRVPLLKSARRFGFIVDESIVASPKTGLPHYNFYRYI